MEECGTGCRFRGGERNGAVMGFGSTGGRTRFEGSW